MRRGFRACRLVPVVCLLALVVGCASDSEPPARASAPPAPCVVYASPKGSDRASGSQAHPVRSVQKLAERARPGRAGCLRSGTYRGGLVVRKGGRPGKPLVLRAEGDARVLVRGRIVVARTAPYTRVQGLYLDGSNARRLPSPTVNARYVRFFQNDVTNRDSAICFNLGDARYGRADRARVDANRIHNCGQRPATNFDHGIYVSAATGAVIERNWIYDNADRGIQLYPDAQRTLIRHNVIYGNGQGVIFSGVGGLHSNGNRVENNVIGGSVLRYNVEAYWPNGVPRPVRNTVRFNCMWGGQAGAETGGVASPVGFSAAENTVSPPAFRDERARALTLLPGTPCWLIAGTSRPGPAAASPVG